ncbi:unnamed protein product [Brassica oleracea]
MQRLYMCTFRMSANVKTEEQGNIFWLIDGEFQDGKDLNKYGDCVLNGSSMTP